MKRCFATCAAAVALAIASSVPASADATGFPALTSAYSVFETFPTVTPSAQAADSFSNLTITLTGSITQGGTSPLNRPAPQVAPDQTWIYSGGFGIMNFTFTGVSSINLSGLTLDLNRNYANQQDTPSPDSVFTASLNGGTGITGSEVGDVPEIAGNPSHLFEYSWNTPIAAGQQFTITFTSPDITHVAFDRFQFAGVAAVPEPSTYALMAVGAVALVFVARRRKVSNS